MRDLARDLRTQAQLEVTARIGELLPLAYPEAEALFRIAQEAINNIWRHAHAQHVLIEAGTYHRRAWLRIQDDGAGFDLAALAESGHGLGNMRTRAELARRIADCAVQPGRRQRDPRRCPSGSRRVMASSPRRETGGRRRPMMTACPRRPISSPRPGSASRSWTITPSSAPACGRCWRRAILEQQDPSGRRANGRHSAFEIAGFVGDQVWT